MSFVGLPFDRVRLMRDRRIPAANVWGAQFYLLEQWGFRKLVDTTFMMGFLVSADAEHDDLERYFRALRRAQAELDLEPERYKRHWLAEMPEDLREAADVRRFGAGRADRVRALHARDVRAHPPLDGALAAVRLPGRASARPTSRPSWRTASTNPRRGAATSAIRWSFFSWASSLIALPGPAEAKPHWVESASWSRG